MTSITLLDAVRLRSPQAWEKFVRLYQPLVYFWARRTGTPPSSCEDVVQDVFARVFMKIRRFRHNGRTGALRRWLRVISRRCSLDALRELPEEKGGALFDGAIKRKPTDPRVELSLEASILYRRAWELIRGAFKLIDQEAFCRVIELSELPSEVAADQGRTANSVSIALTRIKAFLRQEFGDLLPGKSADENTDETK